MADVRSLLRTERAARRLNHPHATYSSSGLLSCSICKISIKSEAVWNSHLKSVGHATRLQQQKGPQLVQVSANLNGPTKKRKLDNEQEDASVKRARGVGKAADYADDDHSKKAQPKLANSDDNVHAKEQSSAKQESSPRAPQESSLSLRSAQEKNVDESEWAAFEREIATSERQKTSTSAFQATPTISAKPAATGGEEASAQETESSQKGSREAELEEEREEAARQAEEELDRMAQLDEKMKSWRQRQKLIRSTRDANPVEELHTGEQQNPKVRLNPDIMGGTGRNDPEVHSEEDEDDDDDDDDDDLDPWRGLGGVT